MSSIIWTCLEILCVGFTVTISIILIAIAGGFFAHILKDEINNWRKK